MAKQDNTGVSTVVTAVLLGVVVGAVIGVIASLVFDNWYFTGATIMSGAIVGFIFSLTKREIH